jgi:predicted DCC family thiol-disulfide oxidoreductase YuxK
VDTETWLRDLEARAARRVPTVPRTLTVLFDPGCRLCLRSRAWMLGQDAYIQLRFLPCTSDEARATFGELPWLGDELVVVSDGGDVWIGPAAFLTCLWALVDWREWSYRLAGPTTAVLAERFFAFVSANRRSLGALVRAPTCKDGHCTLEHA